jgi:hypothetical protein
VSTGNYTHDKEKVALAKRLLLGQCCASCVYLYVYSLLDDEDAPRKECMRVDLNLAGDRAVVENDDYCAYWKNQ